jgi:hypothetical protein
VRFEFVLEQGGLMSEHTIIGVASEQFFSDALHEALSRERVSVSDDAICYIVLLLADPQRSACHPDETLSDVFLRATHLKHSDAVRHLRLIGDKALLFSGLWWEYELRLLRSSHLRLYVDLGTAAYRSVGGIPWTELSNKFEGIVDVLARLGLAQEHATDRNILRLYRRWEATRSSSAARILASQGILVGMPTKEGLG